MEQCKVLKEGKELKEEYENTTEHMQLAHAVETDQLRTENDSLRVQIAEKDLIITQKESVISSKNAYLREQQITSKRLKEQLEKTREYLATTKQPLQVQLSYSQRSDAPVRMTDGQAVVINGKVYYGGGVSDNDDYEYCVHCYSPSEDQWTTLPSLPVCSFGLGEVKGELAAIGGSNSDGVPTNIVQVLAKGRNWELLISPMPTARSSPAVASLPTHLVVAGGHEDCETNIDTVEIYNINTSQWSRTDKLPYVCTALRGTVCRNIVYLVGGYDGYNSLNKVLTAPVDKLLSNSVPTGSEDDGSTDRESAWKEVAHTPSYNPSVVTLSDMVMAVGGWKDSPHSQLTQSIHAYSPSMDSWLYIGDLPSAVGHCATAPLSSTEWILIGGEDENGRHLSTAYVREHHIWLIVD